MKYPIPKLKNLEVLQEHKAALLPMLEGAKAHLWDGSPAKPQCRKSLWLCGAIYKSWQEPAEPSWARDTESTGRASWPLGR